MLNMLHVGYFFLSTAAAWCVGLLFVKMKAVEVLYNSFVIGIVCALVESIMYQAELSRFLPVAILAAFLLMMIVVLLQNTGKYGMSIMAFLIALSAEVIFYFAYVHLTAFQGMLYGVVLCMAVVAVMLVAALLLRRITFENDWNEYFTENLGDVRKFNVRLYHVFLLLTVMCATVVLCLNWIKPGDLYSVFAVVAGFCILLWGCLLAVILMVHYKKEALSMVMERQFRDEMQSFMNVIRSQRHDYNFHVQTMAGLINSGDLASCQKYINELVQDSIATNTMLPVKDAAISAMINNFRLLAAREGIVLHIDIQNDLSNVVTNVYETNKIISNLLQNAIDEVKKHTDKSYGIWLHIFKRGEFCNIRVSNQMQSDVSADEYVRHIFKPGYSTKIGHDGIGLSSIRTLAKRYQGLVYTYLEGSIIHFVAEIPLTYAKRTD